MIKIFMKILYVMHVCQYLIFSYAYLCIDYFLSFSQPVPEGNIIADIPNKKLYVTTEKNQEEISATLKKTGKTTNYVKST